MLKRLTAWAIPFALVTAWQGSLPVTAATPRTVTFEATLLAYGPRLLEKCGQNFVHQVARYRVERVVDGEYAEKEIVAYHPACDGNVFRRIPIGSRVKLTVRALDNYFGTTKHRGIRENERPKIFYVAWSPPKKI